VNVPLVVICALRGRLFPEVVEAVAEQWPDYAIHLDNRHPLASYADFMRTVWAGLGDLVIVEGDCVPPPGSIRALIDCPRQWCSHPSWVGDHYLDNTLGLARFSQSLQEVLPRLADVALAQEPFKGNRHNRGLEEFMAERYLGPVVVEASVAKVWPELQGRAWERALERGTTAHPKAIDMRLSYELTKARVLLHVHEPPSKHLRYPNDPTDWSRRPESQPLDQAAPEPAPGPD
jgi:hypothetical protein